MFTKSKEESRLPQERGCRLDQKPGRGQLRQWHFCDKRAEEELARCDPSSESEGFCTEGRRRGELSAPAGDGQRGRAEGWKTSGGRPRAVKWTTGGGGCGLEDAVTRVSDGASVSDSCWEGETTERREGRCSSVSVRGVF